MKYQIHLIVCFNISLFRITEQK